MGQILQTIMIKPDAIYCHPSHLLYPLWMEWLHKNRDRFNKVIICITDMGVKQTNYTTYLKETLLKDGVIFIDMPRVESGKDWRNEAIQQALVWSTSEWIWFSEQDFMPLKGFWEEVEKLEDSQCFAAFQDTRMHPCCLFIKRSVLDKTSKNFGVVKDKLDHFGQLQVDLEKIAPIWKIDPKTYFHMNGLSQNMYMLQNGDEPNYQPEEFKAYCQKCLELPNLHPDFRQLFEWYIEDDK